MALVTIPALCQACRYAACLDAGMYHSGVQRSRGGRHNQPGSAGGGGGGTPNSNSNHVYHQTPNRKLSAFNYQVWLLTQFPLKYNFCICFITEAGGVLEPMIMGHKLISIKKELTVKIVPEVWPVNYVLQQGEPKDDPLRLAAWGRGVKAAGNNGSGLFPKMALPAHLQGLLASNNSNSTSTEEQVSKARLGSQNRV